MKVDAISSGSGSSSGNLMLKEEELEPTGNKFNKAASGGQERKRRFRRILVLSLFILGLTVCVSSLSCIILLPSFVTNQIAKRLVLKNNSLLLDRWSKPNVPMYFKVWLFDVTNAAQVITGRGVKPVLRELGPFVFHLKRQKDIVSFAGENLYYTERKIYHFSPELSCCAINTTVTVPNIPLVAVVDRALSYNLPLVGRFIPRLINRAIQSLREQLFVRKQVRELLFDGYDVDLLKMVSRVGSLVGLPQSQQRFAIFKGRNDTWRPDQDGVWAINTGARERRLFGRVSSWNAYKQLPFWPEATCNTINGSDGTLFPPPIRKSEPLYIFNQELCRTVNLVFDRPSDIRAIQAYRFVLNPLNFARTTSAARRPVAAAAATGALSSPVASAPRATPTQSVPQAANTNAAPLQLPQPQQQQQQQQRRWQSRQAAPSSPVNQRQPAPQLPQQQQQTTSPEQQARLVQVAQEAHLTRMNPHTCFCDRKSTFLNGANICEFDGLIDLSRCSKQAQVIMGSMPHFYQSDPRLLKQVVGLEPNATKHTTYLDIEPNTGLVLGGKRRVQLNLIIKHNNEVDGFENINDMLVPVIWFEESALIPEESARKFRSLYTDRIRLVNIVLTSLFLAALGLLAIDAKLMASYYTNCFRLSSANQAQAGQVTGGAHGANGVDQIPVEGKRRARNLLTRPTGSVKVGDAKRLPLLDVKAELEVNNSRQQQQVVSNKSQLELAVHYNEAQHLQPQIDFHTNTAESIIKIGHSPPSPAEATPTGGRSPTQQQQQQQQQVRHKSTSTLATNHTNSTTLD